MEEATGYEQLLVCPDAPSGSVTEAAGQEPVRQVQASAAHLGTLTGEGRSARTSLLPAGTRCLFSHDLSRPQAFLLSNTRQVRNRSQTYLLDTFRLRSRRDDARENAGEATDLIHRVVVDERGANHAAVHAEAKAVHQARRVHMPVANGNPSMSHFVGNC